VAQALNPYSFAVPEPRISFQLVCKKFRRGEHHDTLRDIIVAAGRRALRYRPNSRPKVDEFWAVRDVSFDVRPGETLGIIGGNGAGKSTVLKLLTRILRPNSGSIHVEGRIGALIEVSAGFHPDLTGRENVYLQGALMGMRRAAIEERFDEIVEFSGVSEFLDTPVKRYSSGMHARLGFSIAAHLDPDVLVIDEVLAVGDFRFQQRAFGRLQDLAKSGRPVVVVSHQLDRIAQLCSKAIVLVNGRVLAAGDPEACIAAYLGQTGKTAAEDACVTFGVPQLEPATPMAAGRSFTFRVTVDCGDTMPRDTTIGVRVRTLTDNLVLFATTAARQRLALPGSGEFMLSADLEAHLLPGQYVVEAYAFDQLRGVELCASAPTPLVMTGLQEFAVGRANLGGRLALADVESAVEPIPVEHRG
jgi:ABC-type polysaccharide/polyol phosphate transport system ATPase subunit